jgi:tRNA pseudouridine38-40 synthase
MPRYRLTIEYDGGPFVGWQRQANGMSVQQALEEAIAGFSGETVRVQGAGRTDAGVHALGQVAHFDLLREWRPDKMRDALNFHLRPAPIAILLAEPIAEDFDARFSAIRRAYVFRLSDRRAPPVLERGRVWHVRKPLDAEAMDLAAKRLLGRHDFTTFRATECQADSPVRTLERFDVSRRGGEIEAHVEARSFLHNQVRSMVGSLKRVGEGAWTAGDLEAALHARDRTACGQVAPPDGLYLLRVDYPAKEAEC